LDRGDSSLPFKSPSNAIDDVIRAASVNVTLKVRRQLSTPASAGWFTLAWPCLFAVNPVTSMEVSHRHPINRGLQVADEHRLVHRFADLRSLCGRIARSASSARYTIPQD
jgi:hypothetical protein